MSGFMEDIMIRAIRIRMDAGEGLEDILDDYPRLTSTERRKILEKLKE